jgi:Tfp pilus assembly protein PilO
MNNVLLRLAALSSQKAMIYGVMLTVAWYSLVFDNGSALEGKLATLERDVQTEQAKEKESEIALKEIATVQASVGALSDQFKMVSAQLPTDIQMAEIIRTVDKVAQTTGLTVKTKEPKPSVKQDVIEILPLRVTAEGSYSEITMFFYYLSTIERIVRVKSFVMSASSDPRKSSRLTLDADVVSYKFIAGEVTKQ